jgi:hypothetical protein
MVLPLSDFWRRVKEVDRFFQGRDRVHKALRALIKRLEKARIPYAIAGGMAVKAHGYRRTTDDVDFLVTAKGLEEFRKRFVPKYYEDHPQRRRRFTDKANQVIVDFLVTGLYPGNGEPGPIAFPNPEDVAEVVEKSKVIGLATLIQLKLAARRHQDFADVVNLISVHNLDESFADRLHPTLRRDYIECLEEKRREDEFIARNG